MAIYNGKHVVFEQVGLDADTLQWNPSSNVDGDNAYNDYNISDMRNTHLPAKLSALSSELQAIITATTIQTATNGNNGTLISTSDKLFLAAQKEMTTSPYYSRTEENSALTTWNYWTNHTQQSDRIKKDPNNTARYYWLRSPVSGRTDSVVFVSDGGSFGSSSAVGTFRVSLCYAF